MSIQEIDDSSETSGYFSPMNISVGSRRHPNLYDPPPDGQSIRSSYSKPVVDMVNE